MAISSSCETIFALFFGLGCVLVDVPVSFAPVATVAPAAPFSPLSPLSPFSPFSPGGPVTVTTSLRAPASLPFISLSVSVPCLLNKSSSKSLIACISPGSRFCPLYSSINFLSSGKIFEIADSGSLSESRINCLIFASIALTFFERLILAFNASRICNNLILKLLVSSLSNLVFLKKSTNFSYSWHSSECDFKHNSLKRARNINCENETDKRSCDAIL